MCVCVRVRVAQVRVLQDVGVRFAAGDERHVELVLIQRHVVAVNRLARRLLQGGQVHHGTAHHVVLTQTLRQRLERRETHITQHKLHRLHVATTIVHVREYTVNVHLLHLLCRL